jgi:hypothetical protein
MIMSGDTKHLVAMHPYKGISILSPKEFGDGCARSHVRVVLNE